MNELGCRTMAAMAIRQALVDYVGASAGTRAYSEDAEDFLFTDRLDDYIKTFNIIGSNGELLDVEYVRRKAKEFRSCGVEKMHKTCSI